MVSKPVVAQGFSPASGSPKGLRYSFETSSRVIVCRIRIHGIERGLVNQSSGLMRMFL